ncbi:MAG: NUDIX hydrolase [Novosphingobium sp.]|nr:NUDIX hydrolase [Novosphingobium sp.]
MHRRSLIEMLNKYCSEYKAELEFKSRIIDFVNLYSECFKRSLSIGHITASSWLLNKDHSKALLLHHNKLNRWFQLGGHCDGNSDVLAVSIKEAQEESGILGIAPVCNEIFDIDIHLIPENPKEKAHYHYDIRFLLHVTSDEEIIKNHESKELRWISKDINDLPEKSDSLIRMFTKWVNLNL